MPDAELIINDELRAIDLVRLALTMKDGERYVWQHGRLYRYEEKPITS